MKTRDYLILGGLGLGALYFLRKKKEDTANPWGDAVTGAGAAAGNLFGGIFEGFKNLGGQFSDLLNNQPKLAGDAITEALKAQNPTPYINPYNAVNYTQRQLHTYAPTSAGSPISVNPSTGAIKMPNSVIVGGAGGIQGQATIAVPRVGGGYTIVGQTTQTAPAIVPTNPTWGQVKASGYSNVSAWRAATRR